MEQERFDIPVLSPDDGSLPEGTTSPGPFFTLCASLASMAETVARGRKYNPDVMRHEFNFDVRRLLAVARARKVLTSSDISPDERRDLALFLVRDAGFDVPATAIPELGDRALDVASAFMRLVDFMQPHVTSYKE